MKVLRMKDGLIMKKTTSSQLPHKLGIEIEYINKHSLTPPGRDGYRTTELGEERFWSISASDIFPYRSERMTFL